MLTEGSRNAPVGIENWRLWAADRGLPLALGEWSNNFDTTATDSGGGDSPLFFKVMRDWFAAYAGTGVGQLLYEVQFNVYNQNSGRFSVYPQNSRNAESFAQHPTLKWGTR